jgi:hypothetical protein
VYLYVTVKQYIDLIDKHSFLWLNLLLQDSKVLQWLLAILNHPAENWLNFFVMLAINIAGILTLVQHKCRKRCWIMLGYYWAMFQICLLLNHVLFSDLLALNRASPSLLYPAHVKLSTVLGVVVKEYSQNSFPAGHALVAVYWASFTLTYVKGWLRTLVYLVASYLLVARLFTGAHAISDVCLTIILAMMYLAVINKIWKYLENRYV